MVATNSSIIFHENCTATFSRNYASYIGGTFYILESVLSFSENSIVKFTDNRVHSKDRNNRGGGAIFSYLSSIIFDGHSMVTFTRNQVYRNGGKAEGGIELFDEIGGAIVAHDKINFTGNSTVIFSNTCNTARLGGALYVGPNSYDSEIIFQGNTNVTFVSNQAMEGGAVFSSLFSLVAFTGSAVVDFCNNTASLSGGAILLHEYCGILFTGRSNVYFNNNLARQHGGAISSDINARIKYNETCSVMFTSNTAITQGGAIYLFDKSAIHLKTPVMCLILTI